MISVVCLLITACSLKDLQSFFMQHLPLDTSCLFSMCLDDDIADIEKPDEICSLTVVVNDSSGFFYFIIFH